MHSVALRRTDEDSRGANTCESQQPMIVEEGVYHQLRNHYLSPKCTEDELTFDLHLA